MLLATARLVAQEHRAEAKRKAGEADVTVLTVPLMQQELRARLAHGEEIEVPFPKRRADVLALLQAARQARPSIPDAANLAAGGGGGTGGGGGEENAGAHMHMRMHMQMQMQMHMHVHMHMH